MSKLDYKSAMQQLRLQRYKDIANYNKVVGLGIETMWKQLCEKVDSPDLDPTDIFGLQKLMEAKRSLQDLQKLHISID